MIIEKNYLKFIDCYIYLFDFQYDNNIVQLALNPYNPINLLTESSSLVN